MEEMRSTVTTKRKHSALGKRLIASAREMVAHAKGELKLEVEEVRVPSSVKRTKNCSPKRQM
jgi:hypothetical protein